MRIYITYHDGETPTKPTEIMAKKPFKQTRLGKFLRGFLREVPLVGGLRDHASSTDPADGGEKGKLDRAELGGQVIGAALVILPILHTLGILPKWAIELIQSILENIQF